jgi:hypothetical protein
VNEKLEQGRKREELSMRRKELPGMMNEMPRLEKLP